jgi:ATP-binding cassette, subfamily F, member 2
MEIGMVISLLIVILMHCSYGFVGRNGCGKSTFMKVIASRCFPIAEGIDIFHLSEEIEASDMTALEAVMSVDKERTKLEKEAEMLNDTMVEDGSEEQMEVMDRLTQVTNQISYSSFSSPTYLLCIADL